MAASNRIVPAPLPPVYRTLLHALDAVLEEGLPREAIRGPNAATLIADWTRAVEQAEDVIAACPPSQPATEAVIARLVVAAATMCAMARTSGIDPAIAAGAFPEFGMLRAALDAAYASRGADATDGR